MSRRRILERHRETLAEVREIMNSMKTLAYMETRKLSRLLEAQHAVVTDIEEVAADLLANHPEIGAPAAGGARPVVVLVGTERGFCGDFNRALQRFLQQAGQPAGLPLVIAIGHKLNALLEDHPQVVSRLDGAGVVEEVTPVINRLADEIVELQAEHGAVDVYCVHHDGERGIVRRQLLPPFSHLDIPTPGFAHPPVLNLTPAAMLVELTDQYLFAALYDMLYSSMMVENHHRVTHLEGAVQHLDEQSEDLARRSNALRQEEIIEEIEVILIGAGGLERTPEALPCVAWDGTGRTLPAPQS